MKKSTGVILVLIIVLLLGVIGVGGVFFVKGNNDSSKKIGELKNEVSGLSKHIENTTSQSANGIENNTNTSTTQQSKSTEEHKNTSTIKTYNDIKGTYESQEMQRKNARRKMIHWILISLCAIIIIIFISLFLLNSPYSNWDYNDPENAVLGVAFHSFEWLFVRIAPIILIVSIVGIALTRKKV